MALHRLEASPGGRAHHTFLLSQISTHVDYVVEAVSKQIGVLPVPFRDAFERLSTMGSSPRSAST